MDTDTNPGPLPTSSPSLQQVPIAPRMASGNTVSSQERYARKVLKYAKLDVRDDYFSGAHYGHLANFLYSPYVDFGREVGIAIQQAESLPATVCDLTKKRDDSSRTTFFSQPDELSRALDAQAVAMQDESTCHEALATSPAVPFPLSSAGEPPRRKNRTGSQPSGSSSAPELQPGQKHVGRMVFFRGFPSPGWLNHIGASLEVDPELFCRHLDVSTSFLMPSGQRQANYYRYSTPIPTTGDLLQLRVCNTGYWDPKKSRLTLAELRKTCQGMMDTHLRDLAGLRGFSIGDSLVRRFILHDLYNFSIEQRISIEVIHHTAPWSIVVWMDCGHDLGQSKCGPWLSSNPLTKDTRLHPIFQHQPRMALLRQDGEAVPSSSTAGVEPRHPQSIDHLHRNYGRHLRTEIMVYDAFYALHELFEFSAASIDQLLELLGENIRGVPYDVDTARQTELLILKVVLEDYKSYIKDTLETVRARGSPKWPRAIEHRTRADRAASELETRYDRLLSKCERLAGQVESAITLSMNIQAQRQAEKAVQQANRLGKLSVLAYIYIPITFAASFYGMNLVELGRDLSVWTYFAMAVPLLAISMVAWFVDVGAVCLACWRSIKGLFSPVVTSSVQRHT